MKKLLLLAVMALAALNLTGCVVFHSSVDVEGDGSGTAELTMSMSPEIQAALVEYKQMDTGQQEEMDFPLLDDLKQADIEKSAKGHGVKVTRFARTAADGRETVAINLAFDELKGFSYVLGHIMGESEGKGEGMGIFDAGDGNFVLKQAHYDFPAEPAAAPKAPSAPKPEDGATDPAQMQRQMEIMGTLMGAMAELDVSFKVTVPGDIVSTNAPASEGRTSIWAINSGNMMSMEQDMDPEIVFVGKGLKIKPLAE
jgi:hypothetical protein